MPRSTPKAGRPLLESRQSSEFESKKGAAARLKSNSRVLDGGLLAPRGTRFELSQLARLLRSDPCSRRFNDLPGICGSQRRDRSAPGTSLSPR